MHPSNGRKENTAPNPERETKLFGRQVPRHVVLGLGCAILGALLFWPSRSLIIFVLTKWFHFSAMSANHQVGNAIIVWSIEGYCRGVWITAIMKNSALSYALLSVAIFPCLVVVSGVLSGSTDASMIVCVGPALLSSMAGVFMIRAPRSTTQASKQALANASVNSRWFSDQRN